MIFMAIVKKDLKRMSKEELQAKLADIDAEFRRVHLSREKNTAKKKELKKTKSRILNYLSLRSNIRV